MVGIQDAINAGALHSKFLHWLAWCKQEHAVFQERNLKTKCQNLGERPSGF